MENVKCSVEFLPILFAATLVIAFQEVLAKARSMRITTTRYSESLLFAHFTSVCVRLVEVNSLDYLHNRCTVKTIQEPISS